MLRKRPAKNIISLFSKKSLSLIYIICLLFCSISLYLIIYNRQLGLYQTSDRRRGCASDRPSVYLLGLGYSGSRCRGFHLGRYIHRDDGNQRNADFSVSFHHRLFGHLSPYKTNYRQSWTLVSHDCLPCVKRYYPNFHLLQV